MKRGSRDRTVHKRTGGPKMRTYALTAMSAASVRTPATSVLEMSDVPDGGGTACAADLGGAGVPLRGDLGGHLWRRCHCGRDRLGRPCRRRSFEHLRLDDRVLG